MKKDKIIQIYQLAIHRVIFDYLLWLFHYSFLKYFLFGFFGDFVMYEYEFEYICSMGTKHHTLYKCWVVYSFKWASKSRPIWPINISCDERSMWSVVNHQNSIRNGTRCYHADFDNFSKILCLLFREKNVVDSNGTN